MLPEFRAHLGDPPKGTSKRNGQAPTSGGATSLTLGAHESSVKHPAMQISSEGPRIRSTWPYFGRIWPKLGQRRPTFN